MQGSALLFWILSLSLVALIGAAIARAALRARAATGAASGLGIYRDQLAEIDRDLARGVTNPADAEQARTEVSRRLLEADRLHRDAGAGPAGRPLLPLLALGLALGGGVSLYLWLGVPGYPDLPISDRIARAAAFHDGRASQAEAEARHRPPAAPAPDAGMLALVERLRAAVAGRPGDATGLRLLARSEAGLGNFAAAAAAQARLVDLLGADATADDFAALADDYILATGGYVSPEAEAALRKALELAPRHGTARFYMGLMWAQTGRPDLAFPLWRGLIEESPENAPWMPPIREQIARLAQAAGVDYAPPGPGPDAAAVAAAGEMTPEERQEMIRGMVEGLSARLAAEGGPAEDWARLITSLGVLGETDRARAIFAEAQTRFAGRDADLAAVRQAAEAAGVAE